MSELRWTKLQDFCLRLGLLKALVAVLPRQRQPIARDELVRRLQRTLFGVQRPSSVRGSSARRDTTRLSRAERMLHDSASASWGQPIHASTAYKIVEWGLATGLVVTGNRISERGLLLRAIMGEANVEDFLKERENWNPFDLTGSERTFFLYHLGEADELLLQLAMDVGALGAGAICDASRAHRLTADGLRRVIGRVERGLDLQDKARLATLKELSAMIDWEIAARHDTPRPKNRNAKLNVPRRRASGTSKRVTTKSADHQAIPRFEQLVDLGVLTKQSDAADIESLERARKAWTFVVSPEAARFASAAGGTAALEDKAWLWTSFARSVAKAGIGGPITAQTSTQQEALALFLEMFEVIRRPVGHTPFESVAILTVIKSLERGVVTEVNDLHSLMLEIKRDGGLESRLSFAAGNDIRRMYLILGSKNKAVAVNGTLG